MSGQNKICIALLTLAFSSWISPLALASDDWLAESQFLRGYGDYLNHEYGYGAELLYNAIDNGISAESRARLYLAACEVKLGSRPYAAAQLLKVEPEQLSTHDQRLFVTLKNLLAQEIDDATALQVWMAPYGGFLSYAAATNSTGTRAGATAFFYGLNSDLIKENWTFSLGGQSMTYPIANSSPSNQYSGLLGTEVRMGDSFALWGKGIYIAASTANLNADIVGGVGFRWNWASSLVFKSSYFNSYYPNLGTASTNAITGAPNLTLGPLNMNELNSSLRWSFVNQPTQSWSLELGSESIIPSAPGTQDTSTLFTLRSFYERATLQLDAQFSALTLTAGGWTGTEAFGVRGDGYTIYSALEEHHYGWNAGLKVATSSWGFQLLFLQEDVIVSGFELLTATGYGTIFFRF